MHMPRTRADDGQPRIFVLKAEIWIASAEGILVTMSHGHVTSRFEDQPPDPDSSLARLNRISDSPRCISGKIDPSGVTVI